MKYKYKTCVLATMVMFAFLTGCSDKVSSATESATDSLVMKNTEENMKTDMRTETSQPIVENAEVATLDKKYLAEQKKIYIEEKDYEILMASVGEMVYMARMIDPKLSLKEQKQEAMP